MIPFNNNHGTVASVSAILAIGLGALWVYRKAPRSSVIPPDTERVLILGASSGVGRSIAHLYAQRGARVCVVGRRKHLLDEVVRECSERLTQPVVESARPRVISEAADFSDVDDMVRLRALLLQGECEEMFKLIRQP
jgi:NADPH:quinone reductase-like Zn-dependent oxidoreductase